MIPIQTLREYPELVRYIETTYQRPIEEIEEISNDIDWFRPPDIEPMLVKNDLLLSFKDGTMQRLDIRNMTFERAS